MSEQHLDDFHVDPGLHEMSAEGMPERVRRDPRSETGGIGGGVAGAVELAVRDRQQGILAREQPALRAALQPPGAQDRDQLRRQQAVAILRPLPCSTRISIRLLSISLTRRATTSAQRSPAP